MGAVTAKAISNKIPNKAAEAALYENSMLDLTIFSTIKPYKYLALCSCTVSINALGCSGLTHWVIP